MFRRLVIALLFAPFFLTASGGKALVRERRGGRLVPAEL